MGGGSGICIDSTVDYQADGTKFGKTESGFSLAWSWETFSYAFLSVLVKCGLEWRCFKIYSDLYYFGSNNDRITVKQVMRKLLIWKPAFKKKLASRSLTWFIGEKRNLKWAIKGIQNPFWKVIHRDLAELDERTFLTGSLMGSLQVQVNAIWVRFIGRCPWSIWRNNARCRIPFQGWSKKDESQEAASVSIIEKLSDPNASPFFQLLQGKSIIGSKRVKRIIFQLRLIIPWCFSEKVL